MPRVVKPKKYKDVTITTSKGRKIYRYEEVGPGKFEFVGGLLPTTPASRQFGPSPAEARELKGRSEPQHVVHRVSPGRAVGEELRRQERAA